MLKEYRNKIDDIDDKINKLFQERMALVSEIADYKKANNIAVLDNNREAEIFERLSRGAPADEPPHGGGAVAPEYIKTLFKTIFDISKDYQQNRKD